MVHGQHDTARQPFFRPVIDQYAVTTPLQFPMNIGSIGDGPRHRHQFCEGEGGDGFQRMGNDRLAIEISHQLVRLAKARRHPCGQQHGCDTFSPHASALMPWVGEGRRDGHAYRIGFL